MSSAVRRLARDAPRITRGFCNTPAASAEIKKFSHEHLVLGDGHHGLRPGYTYDYEHGPHYLNARAIPNFMFKWNVGLKAMFAVAITIPCFAVWWQQRKMKG